MIEKKRGFSEIPMGGLILEAGNSQEYITGGWRTFRPVLNREKCNDCLLCFWYCPDSSVLVSEGKMVGFDIDHCKGCGICAQICPSSIKAIALVEEAGFRKHPEVGGIRKVTELLKEEHQAILKALDFLEMALASPPRVSLEAAKGPLDLLKEALEGHIGREEQFLFPHLQESLGRAGGPIAAGWEHEEIYGSFLRFIQDVPPLTTLAEEEFTSSLEGLRARGTSLFETLRRHIQKEEEILFPIAERLLDIELLEELGHKMRG